MSAFIWTRVRGNEWCVESAESVEDRRRLADWNGCLAQAASNAAPNHLLAQNQFQACQVSVSTYNAMLAGNNAQNVANYVSGISDATLVAFLGTLMG